MIDPGGFDTDEHPMELERPMPSAEATPLPSSRQALYFFGLAVLLLTSAGIAHRFQRHGAPTVVQYGPTVAVDVSPAAIARAQAELEGKGLTLTETEEGVKPMAKPAISEPVLPEPALPAPAPPTGQKPMIAVIIDDMGLRKAASSRAIRLDRAFTLSYLPYASGIQAQVDQARTAGHEILVHMPMEGKSGADPGPKAMLTSLAPEELQTRLAWNLSRFTGYDGVNNHMGSAFTADEKDMTMVMNRLHNDGMFFIDSRTTPHSTARSLAVGLGMAYAERDVFLDNDQDAGYVAVQLAETENLARRHGSAIAIGHPHDVTLDTLEAWQKTLAAKGIDLVPVNRIVGVRHGPDWRARADRQDQSAG